MAKPLAFLLVCAALAVVSGCVTGSPSTFRNKDESTTAPAYPNRPGIRQAGLEN